MTEKEIYIEIAERFIHSCKENLDKRINIQEAIGFNAYHAFESIGGAYNAHIGERVPMAHNKKIDSFAFNYRRNPIARVDPSRIAYLAIILTNLRNKLLYPDATPAGLVAPKDQLSLSNIKTLTSQINGVIRLLTASMT